MTDTISKEDAKMQKKFLGGLVVTLTTLLLTGCCMSHDWQDATCTEPKTCVKCGKTEGEALGHTWVDATCTEPKTCSVCGATEGEALGHTWVDATCTEPKTCSVCGATEGEALGHTLTEANYQQASTCTVCGETVGDPLQAYFEEHELTEYLVELDKEYDYITMCNDNTSCTTIGKVIFSNYRTYTSDDIHPEKEGYEWKSVDFSILYSDANAQAYGMSIGMYADDYYNDVIFFDERTINYYGVDYTDIVLTADNTNKFSGWKNDENTYTGTISVSVPCGYDGVILTFANDQISWEYAADLKDTSPLFFRFE